MKRSFCAIVMALISAGACASDSGTATARGKVVEARVDVFGWNDARTGATLIDRQGRRTGWNGERPVDQIPGCMYEPASEEGIPDETRADTLGQRAALDTASHGHPATPMEHFFKIFNDAITPVGLIDQGGCELRLDPVVGGKIKLALAASGVGLKASEDTTSIWVTAGVQSRWTLTWKVAGEKCAVRIARIAAKGSTPATK